MTNVMRFEAAIRRPVAKGHWPPKDVQRIAEHRDPRQKWYVKDCKPENSTLKAGCLRASRGVGVQRFRATRTTLGCSIAIASSCIFLARLSSDEVGRETVVADAGLVMLLRKYRSPYL